MKRIIITFLLSILTVTVFSQDLSYPRYEKDSLGNPVIIMTIDQAMKLDNNSELLGLFEKLNSQIGQYDSACVKVINDKDKVIALKNIEISNLKKSLSTKDEEIVALQSTISECRGVIIALESQLKKTNDIVSEKNKRIRKLKFKMAVGGIGGTLAVIGLITSLLKQ